ncbi:MAG: hypothetical protein ABI642_12840 [Polaromonas sp.]
MCIAVTCYSHERDRKTALEEGFQPGLVQPVDPGGTAGWSGVAFSKAPPAVC